MYGRTIGIGVYIAETMWHRTTRRSLKTVIRVSNNIESIRNRPVDRHRSFQKHDLQATKAICLIRSPDDFV